MSSEERKELSRIKQVRAYIQKKEEKDGAHGADCHDHADGHWILGDGSYPPIANPLSKYPNYCLSRKTWGINALGSVIVEVEAENGTTGFGVSIGGEPACFLIEKHLSRFV